MLTIFSPEMKSKSEEPSYYTDGEAMFREKFSENLQMVEDIITSFGDDGNQLTKSKELGRLARMEDRLSPYYNMCADAILSLGLLAF